MPSFDTAGKSIHYETYGKGSPVLAFAPGGMQSAIGRWQQSKLKAPELLSGGFQVIVMDQRNAGQSSAPITASDGWQSYTEDHLALLDHLGIDRCHLLGVCIGGAFCLSLMKAQPERILSAVLVQPIGNSGHNRSEFHALFDAWAAELPERVRPDAASLESFRSNLYDGDFVFSVSRDFVKRCPVPLLVLMGDDKYHPSTISREVAKLAPAGTLIEDWKEGDQLRAAERAVLGFLKQHSSGVR